MSKFDKAREKSNELTFPYNMFFDDFITSCEETEHQLRQEKKAYLGCSTRYDELVKDVKRYIELVETNGNIKTIYTLFDKLSKVGVENDKRT